jgi:gamma-glutamyltranspeptidase/glutathione hydrolase
MKKHHSKKFLALCLFVLAASVHGEAPQPRPEAAVSVEVKPALAARRALVVAAHPLAAEAGREILRLGGSAADAAIATAFVLGLVEPQSSGLGGGAYALSWNPQTRKVRAFDGRETAPAIAGPAWFLGADGRTMGLREAIASGCAVGAPGLVAVLARLHEREGRLPWARLVRPAQRLAREGFPVSPRLAAQLALPPGIEDREARALYFDAEGRPFPVGHTLRNPRYADTLELIALKGPAAMQTGEVAAAIVARTREAAGRPTLSLADLASYQAIEREALCANYRAYRICSMSPSSSGGSTVLAMLGILSRFDLAALRPVSAGSIHLFAEAGRLAYADRDRYLGDPAFVSVPLEGLLAPDYLAERAGHISLARSMVKAEAGLPRGAKAQASSASYPEAGTTHLSVVDGEGHAVSLTSSVEDAFGSRIWVKGFFLNNQLTDFSAPGPTPGTVANAVGPRKRPRSSMSPTLVFDAEGKLFAVLGSAGGGAIINHVAETLVALIDWKLAPAEALALPRFGSRNGPTELEAGTRAEALADSLRALGHEVRVGPDPSGLHLVVRDPRGGWLGAADPRRDGAARGD